MKKMKKMLTLLATLASAATCLTAIPSCFCPHLAQITTCESWGSYYFDEANPRLPKSAAGFAVALGRVHFKRRNALYRVLPFRQPALRNIWSS